MSELHAVQETRGSKCGSIWEKQSGGLFRSECISHRGRQVAAPTINLFASLVKGGGNAVGVDGGIFPLPHTPLLVTRRLKWNVYCKGLWRMLY